MPSFLLNTFNISSLHTTHLVFYHHQFSLQYVALNHLYFVQNIIEYYEYYYMNISG